MASRTALLARQLRRCTPERAHVVSYRWPDGTDCMIRATSGGRSAAAGAGRAAQSHAQAGPTDDAPSTSGRGAAPGDGALAFWRSLLAGGAYRAESLRDGQAARQLLQTALRLRQGRAQSTLPEQAAALLMQIYQGLDAQGRRQLLLSLTSEFGVQRQRVDAAAAAWQQLSAGAAAAGADTGSNGSGSDSTSGGGTGGMQAQEEQLARAAAALSEAAQPLYSHLFVPLSQQRCGIKFLVDMRADLLASIAARPAGAGPLRALSEALRRRLAEWFSVGLMSLERLTWEDSSAALLEKVVAGEAVHAYQGWGDLRARLDPASRRVFAFFHPAMPGEPLVVLHTALTDRVAESMREILPHAAGSGPAAAAGSAASATGSSAEAGAGSGSVPAAKPTTAVFYSISAYQRGLAGVDLGQFLIKQVAQRLLAEHPSIGTLVTLSPLPGFADWIQAQVSLARGGAAAAPLLLASEAAALADATAWEWEDASAACSHSGGGGGGGRGEQAEQQQSAQRRAADLLSRALGDGAWVCNPRLEAALRPALLRLAARYLLRERRRGLALDPVANFHLRNGASVLALRWRADTSAAGMGRSHAIMVNYQYTLDEVAANNRRYLVDRTVVAAPEVEALLQPAGGRVT